MSPLLCPCLSSYTNASLTAFRKRRLVPENAPRVGIDGLSLFFVMDLSVVIILPIQELLLLSPLEVNQRLYLVQHPKSLSCSCLYFSFSVRAEFVFFSFADN